MPMSPSTTQKNWHIDSSFWSTLVDCLHTSAKKLMIDSTMQYISSVHITTISESNKKKKFKVQSRSDIKFHTNLLDT